MRFLVFHSLVSFPLSCFPEMQFGLDLASRSFRNLTLSYRGSERQAPNCLGLALRFSRIMECRDAEGRHAPGSSTEERLKDIIMEFHQSPGLAAKHRLDEEKTRTVLHMICGTGSALRLKHCCAQKGWFFFETPNVQDPS